ncbi:MAG: class I SAM-dependent methyltransferase [Nanoarchaeota archaeon]|nr:class I SAM-dependent methyltransferase [Nanoarchaeota archaeon]MBU1854203.1 class I SAM-dependent methyltransferase [Nanoarchaeota archaeon]
MAEHVRNNLILVESDVIDIDFPDDTFDIVIAHQVLQYVNDKQRAKDELFRVTRNNGFIFPNGFVYQKVGDKLQRVSGRRKSYWDSEGVLPTTRINNKQLPFVLETQIHDVNYNYLFVGENFPVIKPIDFL